MANVILFASGRGSNIQAILDYFQNNKSFNPTLIVCNKPDIGAITIAEKHNIPYVIVNKTSFHSESFVDTLKEYNPDLIILAGFLWKIPLGVLQAFPNKVINIHPALLPKYGGKGMYGHYVHEAVINNQEKESGITIHYVNENYDEGNHICQAHCSITHDDTPATLGEKIHKLEHYFFPRTIEYLLFK